LDLTYLEDFSLEATLPQTREEVEDIEKEGWWKDALNSYMAHPCDLKVPDRRVLTAPHLTKVALYNTLIPNDCGLLTNVTDFTFNLSWGQYDSSMANIQHEMLEMIACLANLRILNLEWNARHRMARSFHSLSPSFLPELRRLRLCIPIESCRALLSRIESRVLEQITLHMTPLRSGSVEDGWLRAQLYEQLEAVIKPYGPPASLHLTEAYTETGNHNSLYWGRNSDNGDLIIGAYGDLSLPFMPMQRSEPRLHTRPFFSQFTSIRWEAPHFHHGTALDNLTTLCEWQLKVTHISLMRFKAGRAVMQVLLSRLRSKASSDPPALMCLTDIMVEGHSDDQKILDMLLEVRLQQAISDYMKERATQRLQNLSKLTIQDSLLGLSSWNKQAMVIEGHVQEVIVTPSIVDAHDMRTD
jgi:hypothetical protein